MTVDKERSLVAMGQNKTSNGKSFRNVSMHNNAMVTDIELKPALNKTIDRLQTSASGAAPFATRKSGSNKSATENVRPLTVPEEFNLSQILNKLSSLSHELSISLEQARAEDSKQKAKNSEGAPKRNPLKPVNGRSNNSTAASPLKRKSKQRIQPESANVSKASVHLTEGSVPIGNLSLANSSMASVGQTKVPKKTKLDFSNHTPKLESSKGKLDLTQSRAKLEIEKYRSKVPDFLTEKERAQEIEELDRKIAELMKS